MADDLPAWLFMARGAWFVAQLPEPSNTQDFAARVARFASDGSVCLPVFSSEQRAADFAAEGFGDEVEGYGCFTFTNPQYTGACIAVAALAGFAYIALNPEAGRALELFSAGDAAESIRRHLLGHGPSTN